MVRDAFVNLTYETRERTAWLTVSRPEKLNALNRDTMREIGEAVHRALVDPEVGVLVVTGAGEKAFVAGADIQEMAGLDPWQAQQFSRFLTETLHKIERAHKPVIAAVNGFALGGGCELALACHIRIASESARFAQPEVNLGLIPGAGGTQRLQRVVGRGRALDLILTGDMIDSAEAYRIGLVNRVVPPAALYREVSVYAETLNAKSPQALARVLEALVSGGEMPQSEAMRFESSLFGLCFATEDMREGTRAFLEKRKARFTGR